MSTYNWVLTFSQELLDKKRQDIQNRYNLQQKQSSRENHTLFQKSGAYKKFEKTKHSPNYIKRIHEKDTLKPLTLSEYLKLQNIDDYDKRIKHIIQTFHLSPIHLKIPADMQKNLIQSILSQMNQPAKEIDIKISSNNFAINYKNRLYVLSTIIITLEPASNYDQNKFDINVFSENGDMICSFHNFQSMERLVKSLVNKFRRLQKIYYMQILDSRNACLDHFFQLKAVFEVHKIPINLKAIFYSSQNHIITQNNSNKTPTFHNRVNDKEFANCDDFSNFCYSNSIELANYGKDFELQGQKQLESKLNRLIRGVLRKKQCDNILLNFICYGDKKIIEYRKRNEISLRLVNYFIQNIKNLEFIGSSKQNFSKIQEFSNNLITQILAEKEKQSRTQLQRLNQQSLNHEPQKVEKCTRLCLKCRQKTRHRCKKCSLKYRMEVMLCTECFQEFHSQKYFNQIALPILTSKTKIQNGFAKYSYLTKRLKHQFKSKRSIKSQRNKLNMLKLNEIDRETMGNENEQILDPLKKYQNMRKFVFICHQISQQNN